LRQRGHLRRLFRNQLAALKSLHDGGIDHAYLWANAGWTLHTSPDLDLQFVPGYVPEDHWNIAIAMCQGDEDLKSRVDTAVEKLVKDGTVSQSLAKYHVPYFRPFQEASGGSQSSGGPDVRDADVIRHKPAERGLEPQLEKVQTSKIPYGGLARIRSAGELVVGLDRSNLPFSTAYPKPAGLDYEIAGLLAEKLGLSLRVYWAYSAHDSYPSKLASKKFCDVILGVMPDDRFGQRVLYSKPYYTAGYQLVVRAGESSPGSLEQLGDQPLAVEPGVVTRGVERRKTVSYPSLESILEAVATNRVKAGYVISTRGPWLAEQRWPGKLKFVTATGGVDSFPICAAVRKGDGDLKAALDRAIEELHQSGELVKVFDHYNIPYASARK
jgi:ABC-type amino acid transport substrate-binding protein